MEDVDATDTDEKKSSSEDGGGGVADGNLTAEAGGPGSDADSISTGCSLIFFIKLGFFFFCFFF